MRNRHCNQYYLDFTEKSSLKVVREFRGKYRRISDILDDNPRILNLVHKDFQILSTSAEKGRSGDYTSETIFRTIVIHGQECTPYRETAIRIADSRFFQWFIRLKPRQSTPDYSFIAKAFKAIKPNTWRKINRLLAKYGIRKEVVDITKIRGDSTVVESNIHYPTDIALLWDSYEFLSRTVRLFREVLPKAEPIRLHDRKAKKNYLLFLRLNKSRSKRQRNKAMKNFNELRVRVERVLNYVKAYQPQYNMHSADQPLAVYEKYARTLAAIETVVEVANRVFAGEKVPASDRVFSIYEPHVELIKRGKSNKPVEFGHKVVLCQTKDKFITYFETLEIQCIDSKLTDYLLSQHRKDFGKYPEVFTADRGFRARKEKVVRQETKVKNLAIPARLSDWTRKLQPWQKFRAGIEGTISLLKRGFRLFRCLYRGFKSFASAVGMEIVSHNLFQLARALK